MYSLCLHWGSRGEKGKSCLLRIYDGITLQWRSLYRLLPFFPSNSFLLSLSFLYRRFNCIDRLNKSESTLNRTNIGDREGEKRIKREIILGKLILFMANKKKKKEMKKDKVANIFGPVKINFFPLHSKAVDQEEKDGRGAIH